MLTRQKMLFFLLILSLLLPACGSSDTPLLGIAGKPAVVFVYTDG